MNTTAVEIKGRNLAVLVLQIKDTDSESLYDQVHKNIGKGQSFFAKAPFLIDFGEIDAAQQQNVDLNRLVMTLRNLGVVPVAVRGIDESLEQQALQSGIGILPAQSAITSLSVSEIEDKNAKATQDKEQEHEGKDEVPSTKPERVAPLTSDNRKTKVVTRPVRSGQRIVTQGDLIVLSSVNAGAEVLAGGNIHIYGPLRGRALAGIDGDKDTCIFSAQCNPELVAVAGTYMVNEALSREVVNRSVIIRCEGDGLKFTPLALSR